MSEALKSLDSETLDRFVRIHAALSPECLSGDGEIPAHEQLATKFDLDAELFGLQMRFGLRQDDVGEDSIMAEYDRRHDLIRRGTFGAVRMGA